MGKNILNKIQLNELAKFDTPTVSNAIETFKIRDKTEGFMNPSIQSIIEYDKPVVGYAVTAKISATEPSKKQHAEIKKKYLKKHHDFSLPTIAVIEDEDPEPIGSMWGEVNASIHMALGCSGVVTNGGVRDLDEVEDIGFRYFASDVLVSHAYVHYIDVNTVVNVGGLKVEPRDLIHADKHGVLKIPHEIAPEVAEACRKVERAESKIIRECQNRIGEGIEFDYLYDLLMEMYKMRDK